MCISTEMCDRGGPTLVMEAECAIGVVQLMNSTHLPVICHGIWNIVPPSFCPYILVQLALPYTLSRAICHPHEFELEGGGSVQPPSIHAPRDFNNPFWVPTITLILLQAPIASKALLDQAKLCLPKQYHIISCHITSHHIISHHIISHQSRAMGHVNL